MIKSILLSVDGSAYTDSVVKHGIRLAKAFDSVIEVISIVDIRIFEWAVAMGTDGFVPVIPSTIYQEESKKMLETKANAVLKKCASILKKENIKFETEKLHGSPVDIICDKSHLVDLLIMGARGEFAKWESTLVGATLEAVGRQCNKPIFIVPKKYNEIHDILFAYDGSDKANKGLQLAGYIATKLPVTTTILTVNENEQLRNKFLQEANKYLEPYKIAVNLTGKSGSPEKEIVSFAEENKSDAIVMGAFGQSRIRKAILGSTTEYVMRNSKIPVLLVN
jgi:nucleotide-binding universal stress UspA family protein